MRFNIIGCVWKLDWNRIESVRNRTLDPLKLFVTRLHQELESGVFSQSHIHELLGSEQSFQFRKYCQLIVAWGRGG